jgi:excisionase family DNA binding protein
VNSKSEGGDGMAIGQRSSVSDWGSRWLNYLQAMEVLDVSRSTLDGWRKSGHLVFAKLPNGQLRIRRKDLDMWLESLVEQG